MNGGKLLSEARAEVMDGRGFPAGIKCPCCDQLAKLYKRRIHRTMAEQLLRFAKLSVEASRALEDGVFFVERPGWVDVKRLPMRGGDFAKLSAWGLIEEKPKDPDDKTKRTSGIWRLTTFGLDFVNGAASVPTYKLFYNGEVVGSDGPNITIHSAMDRFVYAQLWGHQS